MIGKDMTKMTLPVSFNEPTSLLQRVAEDMEYTELLDMAADRADSTERLVYVAAFAASEYASTIGRVAKPFNPLLGETYEYARPDKGYRFFIEQVSHHPPIGAAWAESPNWDYYVRIVRLDKINYRESDLLILDRANLLSDPNSTAKPLISTLSEPGSCAFAPPLLMLHLSSTRGKRSPLPSLVSLLATPPSIIMVLWRSATIQQAKSVL